ncbi:DUF4183 domain-containing protein [Sporosarcina sp. ACRSM]|uniref:DUF4183 domain-containing protein n=1 Tax=Sporosarcina sp. ACRSM TaxID=2918216 RepID=UPI001EF6A47E|nr:DUF4183 domain-containing protein [Sporosarcina sp. ACRSM]MCG7335168.1 DUF4183 domain-containing protein [Sporosarcina sp. ACRSM]
MCKNTRCKRKKITEVKSCEIRNRYGPYTMVPPNPDPNPLPPAPIPEMTIVPIVNRYFYIPQTSIDLANGATIPATLFYDDNEDQVDEFTIFSPNGYVNLHINGVIQEGGFYQANSNALTINPANGIIRAGTPIIVESLGFTTAKL